MTATARPWKHENVFSGDNFCYVNILQDDGMPFSATAASVWANVILDGAITKERERAEANAALIVKAVNNHDALVDALEQYMSQFGQALDANKIAYTKYQQDAHNKAMAVLAKVKHDPS